MPVATKTVKKLIQQSLERVGMYEEDVSGGSEYLVKGLDILNDLLDSFASPGSKIAYYSTLTFPVVSGKQTYTFSKEVGADVDSEKIVALKEVTLLDGTNIYPVKISPDSYYYNGWRATTDTWIPDQVFLQNSTNASTLTFFSKPPKGYTGEIKAKFTLEHVTLNQILDILPGYYYRFLIYALASEFNDIFDGSTWNVKKENRLIELKNQVSSTSDMDMEINTNNIISGNRGRNRNAIYRGFN